MTAIRQGEGCDCQAERGGVGFDAAPWHPARASWLVVLHVFGQPSPHVRYGPAVYLKTHGREPKCDGRWLVVPVIFEKCEALRYDPFVPAILKGEQRHRSCRN